jgi:OTU domain-containing protein 6
MSTPEETVLETTLEELEARQRREQRELTQRITGMKKAVPKGDKRRKKEVQLEIAKLEAEQAQRHARELEAFKQAHATETVNEEATADEPAPAPVVRMSKQQRRKASLIALYFLICVLIPS